MRDEGTPAATRRDLNAWWRRDDVFAAALLTLALIPRLYVALAWAREPVWDGHYYDFGARRIAEGQGYSDDITIAGQLVWHPWCHYPVGYSAFLAFFYRIFGATQVTSGIVNATVGAGLAFVTWRLADLVLPRGPDGDGIAAPRPTSMRARAAGLLVALHPGLILYSALVMTEPLAALATLTAFWIAARRGVRWRGKFIVSALVLGVAALVRPQALLCAPFLALTIPDKRVVPRLVAAGFASVLAILPVLPWTARNCRVMDGCALVSTNAGWNLAIGAFPRATGRFEALHASDGCKDVTGQVQQDRCWLDYGVAQIRAEPRRWLSLVPAKLGFTFDHESFAVEYLHQASKDDWPENRRAGFRGLTTMFHRLLVCAAALGCVAFRVTGRGAAVQGALLAMVLGLAWFAFAAHTPTFWPLVVFAGIVPWLPLPGAVPRTPALWLGLALLDTTIVTHAVFFGEDRYHMVVTPIFCILAACAVRVGARKAPTRSAQ